MIDAVVEKVTDTLPNLGTAVVLMAMLLVFLYGITERIFAPIFKEYIIAKFEVVKDGQEDLEKHLTVQDTVLSGIDNKITDAHKRLDNHEVRITKLEN